MLPASMHFVLVQEYPIGNRIIQIFLLLIVFITRWRHGKIYTL